MALPIPVIVNNFTQFYSHAKARQKLKDYSSVQNDLQNKAIAMHFQSNQVEYEGSGSHANLDIIENNTSTFSLGTNSKRRFKRIQTP